MVPRRSTLEGSGTGEGLFQLTVRLSMPIVAGQSTKSSSVSLAFAPRVPDHVPISCGAVSELESGDLVELPSLPFDAGATAVITPLLPKPDTIGSTPPVFVPASKSKVGRFAL